MLPEERVGIESVEGDAIGTEISGEELVREERAECGERVGREGGVYTV